MKRVAFCNSNGSTAKSTSVAALAYLLAEQGRRVLVLDLDPQANITRDWLGGSRASGVSQAVRLVVANGPTAWPGVSAEEMRAELRRMLLRAIQHTDSGVDLIGADTALQALIEKWHDLSPTPELLLAELLDALDDDYDVAFMDCKGDLGVLTQAAVRAATDVVGVATPTLKALAGLQTIRQEVEKVDGATIRAVLPVAIRPRNRGADADDLYTDMRTLWPTTPPVRGAANLDYASAIHQPVTMLEPRSGVSEDYRAVLADLVERGVL